MSVAKELMVIHMFFMVYRQTWTSGMSQMLADRETLSVAISGTPSNTSRPNAIILATKTVHLAGLISM